MFELFTLLEHLDFVCGVLVAQSFASGEVFCISLFVCWSIFLLASMLSVRRLITLGIFILYDK